MNNIKKIASDDWRRQGQERFLKGVKLKEKNYRPYSLEWDHDHCEFCGAKFSAQKEDLKKGYSTKDNYYWICNLCFNDFKDEFCWSIEE